MDRNGNGEGVMIYVGEDITSDQLSKHSIPKIVEAIFVEINLRKNKFLLIGAYHTTSHEFGTSDTVFFEQIGFSLDIHSSCDKFLLGSKYPGRV